MSFDSEGNFLAMPLVGFHGFRNNVNKGALGEWDCSISSMKLSNHLGSGGST